jgi:hypothetical protein
MVALVKVGLDLIRYAASIRRLVVFSVLLTVSAKWCGKSKPNLLEKEIRLFS